MTGVLLFYVCESARATKYAGEFLYLGVGGRALAMGGAFTAIADDATASYWNPAGLVNVPQREAIFMHSESFGKLLNLDYLSVVLPSDAGAFGFSAMRLGGGGIKLTGIEDPSQPISETNRAYEVGEANHADYAFNLSYAKKAGDRVSIGVNGKIIYRDIPETSAWGLGLDLGILYSLRESVKLALVLQDATSTYLSYSTGSKETIAPSLKVGLAYQKNWRDFDATISGDANFLFEDRSSSSQYVMGSMSADNNYGLEIAYQKILFGRMGFHYGEFTAGAGVLVANWGLDFAYLNNEELDNSYQFSLKVKW